VLLLLLLLGAQEGQMLLMQLLSVDSKLRRLLPGTAGPVSLLLCSGEGCGSWS
jgi:hypothetical protein